MHVLNVIVIVSTDSYLVWRSLQEDFQLYIEFSKLRSIFFVNLLVPRPETYS